MRNAPGVVEKPAADGSALLADAYSIRLVEGDHARKLFDTRYVDVSAVWSAPHDDDQAVCLTQLDFTGNVCSGMGT